MADDSVSFRLMEVVAASGGRLLGSQDDQTLERLVIDSRQATPGAMFWARRGETADGHDFIPAAVAAGASAVLTEREAAVSAAQVLVANTNAAVAAFAHAHVTAAGIPVVAVTGSVGKTTTKDLIAGVLARKLNVLKTEGNLNTETGVPMTIARLGPQHEVLVAEYAMNAKGDIAYLAAMAPPAIAVVLNVGVSHAGMVGSVEAVQAAKQELVEGTPGGGTVVLNADDPRVMAMAAATRARIVTFSASGGEADFRASAVRPDGLQGTSFRLTTRSGEIDVRLAIPGTHAIGNALAAAAVGELLGVELAGIASGLGEYRPGPGRLGLVAGRHGSSIIDDTYNSSPQSAEAALRVLTAEQGRTRIAILGDMLELGNEARAAHLQVGRAASRVDLLVVLGANADLLAEGATSAGLDPRRIVRVVGIDAALAAVEPHLEGALVLVKASRGIALERLVDQLKAGA